MEEQYYVTRPIQPVSKQITLEEILAGEIEDLYKYSPKTNWTTTRTTKQDYCPLQNTSIARLLDEFNNEFGHLREDDMSPYYSTFRIPKAKGGFRTIDNPNEELRKAHKKLKEIFESVCTPYHTAAFAYVQNRCAKDAVAKHQMNQSNWCLRTDFSNFFGSVTPEFLHKMLCMQYPFCSMTVHGKEALRKALSLCFLRGGLPQGTTISPLLTNMMMIPIDYTIFNDLVHRQFVYTRYADDIQISAKQKFDYKSIVAYVDSVLEKFEAPFRIKPEKTKWSSVAGINYMLGLNLNKDHNITVGHARKKTFKAMVNNFFADWLNGVKWETENIQYMKGIWSYYRSIEPDYTDYMVRHLETKYGLSFHETVKRALKEH